MERTGRIKVNGYKTYFGGKSGSGTRWKKKQKIFLFVVLLITFVLFGRSGEHNVGKRILEE